MLRFPVVLVVGLLVGAATSLLQTVLPDAVSSLANSGAVWALAGILVAYLLRRGIAVTTLLGVLALIGEVLGYYGTSAARGFGVSVGSVAFWLLAAVVFGAVGGAAAGLLGEPAMHRRLTGLAVPTGILLGEGGYLVTAVGRAVLVPYGIVSMVLGAGWAVAGALRIGHGVLPRIGAVLGTLLVAVAVAGAYLIG